MWTTEPMVKQDALNKDDWTVTVGRCNGLGEVDLTAVIDLSMFNPRKEVLAKQEETLLRQMMAETLLSASSAEEDDEDDKKQQQRLPQLSSKALRLMRAKKKK